MMEKRFLPGLLFVVIAAVFVSACLIGSGKNGDDSSDQKIVIKEVSRECPPCPCGPEVEEKKSLEGLNSDDGPAQSILYHITDMYAPVQFNHKAHTQYAQGCGDCHHHHSDVEKTPACRECHGKANTDTLSKPGLKGAYHRQCMNCHRQMGAGPLECEACHTKRTDKDPSLAKVAQANSPQKAILGHLSKEYQPVQFDHRLHEALTDSCVHCHHQQSDVETTPPCRECHNTTATTGKGDKLALKDAYHEQCRNCHRGKGSGPLGCTDCHAKKTK